MKDSLQATTARLTARRAKALGLTQSEIANAVGASQSQVSRVLAGRGSFKSRLFIDICNYVRTRDSGITVEAVRRNAELMEALAAVWDGSPMQSLALAGVIRSLGAFTYDPPATRPAGRASRRRS